MAKESSTVAFSNKNLMFFNLKVYLLCFKPTKKPLDAAVDLKFATLKIPLSILLINCKVVFFFTQWQAMRAVGTTHVILYRVDNLSTRSPRPWQAPLFNSARVAFLWLKKNLKPCMYTENWRFHHLRPIVPQSCCSSLILSALVSKWKVLEINNPMKSQWCLYTTAMGCAKKYNTGLPRSPYSCWYL